MRVRRAAAGLGPRKVRTPQGRMPANGRAARADGQCSREQTADGPAASGRTGTGKGETVV